jgi:hypothetical protein
MALLWSRRLNCAAKAASPHGRGKRHKEKRRSSVQEVDSLIAELQTMRGLLQDQGARIRRDLAEYAHLSQSAVQSTKIIADSLVQWKKFGGWPSP